MSEADPDRDLEESAEVLEAPTGEFLDALAKVCSPGGDANALKKIEQIRKAFTPPAQAPVAGEESLLPRFPGFETLEKLGEGGFGAVYRARDEKLGRFVALKMIRPRSAQEKEAGARFLAEARTLAAVRHANVLAIHAVLEHEDRIALVTEFIDGITLERLIEERGPFGAGEAAQVGAELCRGLAAVHAAGIVHRDVKPANVIRERGGRIVLADFGLGIFLAKARSDEGRAVGSPIYMAPEQARGEVVDARTDLYAAGVVLYKLATGKLPVPPGTMRQVLERVRAGRVVPLLDVRADLPRDFVQVVTRALAADAGERFQSAGEMEAALRAVTGSAAAEETATLRVVRRPRRLRAWAAAAIVLVALAAVVLALRGRGSAFHVERASLMTAGGRRINEGQVISVGDALHLEFRADAKVHVYVLNEDERGERHLLFPRPGGDLRNPLAGGSDHRLPGPVEGKEQDWVVSSAGGREWVFIAATTEPMKELEDLVARARSAGALDGYPALPDSAVHEVLRGIGKTKDAVASPLPVNAAVLERQIAELRDIEETGGAADGVWVRRVSLRNP